MRSFFMFLTLEKDASNGAPVLPSLARLSIAALWAAGCAKAPARDERSARSTTLVAFPPAASARRASELASTPNGTPRSSMRLSQAEALRRCPARTWERITASNACHGSLFALICNLLSSHSSALALSSDRAHADASMSHTSATGASPRARRSRSQRRARASAETRSPESTRSLTTLLVSVRRLAGGVVLSMSSNVCRASASGSKSSISGGGAAAIVEADDLRRRGNHGRGIETPPRLVHGLCVRLAAGTATATIAARGTREEARLSRSPQQRNRAHRRRPRRCGFGAGCLRGPNAAALQRAATVRQNRRCRVARLQQTFQGGAREQGASNISP
mmetsp:Transcript_14621/g.40248  ORF Transcript_14621/g.40248 Transcript_14621/m.40248 type:complete len:334 (+) Transcript_14621:891-1892(+)